MTGFDFPSQLSLATIWNIEPAELQISLPKLPVFRVHLVREGHHPDSGERASMDGPDTVATAFLEFLQYADRENFVVMMLCCKNRLIGMHTVSIGTLNSAPVSPRDVFKAAILANAASIIVGHNHPSGDPDPSPEDISVTRVLCQAGKLLDIPVMDHIIIGDNGRFSSLSRMGLLDSYS